MANPPFGTKKGGDRPTRNDLVYPSSNKQLRISVVPDSLDIAGSRSQLLSIADAFSTFTATIDKIATSGQVGAISYTSESRFK